MIKLFKNWFNKKEKKDDQSLFCINYDESDNMIRMSLNKEKILRINNPQLMAVFFTFGSETYINMAISTMKVWYYEALTANDTEALNFHQKFWAIVAAREGNNNVRNNNKEPMIPSYRVIDTMRNK